MPNSFLAGVLGGSQSVNARIFEPQRSNNGILRIDTLAKVPGIASDGADSLELGLSSFTLPKQESGQTIIPYINEVRKFAGRTMFDNVSATFYDYLDRKTLQTLLQWRVAIYNPMTGTHGLKSQYACTGTITMFPPNGDKSMNMTYMLQGIFPLAFDPGNIDFGSDEPVRIQVNFSIDKAIAQNVAGLTYDTNVVNDPGF